MWKIGKNLSTNTKHLPTEETTSSYTKHPTSSPEGKTGKVLSQLLLPCPIASDLWYFSSLVGISWVMPNSVVSMLVSLNGMLGSHRYGTRRGGWGVAHVWCGAFGVKGIATFSRTKNPLYQTSIFYFWRLFMNGNGSPPLSPCFLWWNS